MNIFVCLILIGSGGPGTRRSTSKGGSKDVMGGKTGMLLQLAF